MVRLVEVVLEPGKRACPPLATPAGASRLRCAAHPGYAGVGVPRDLHHSLGRQLGFTDYEQIYAKKTRRQRFLDDMEATVPGRRFWP